MNKYWLQIKWAYYKAVLCIATENINAIRPDVLIYLNDLVCMFECVCLETLVEKRDCNNSMLIMSLNYWLEKKNQLLKQEGGKNLESLSLIQYLRNKGGVVWPPGLEVNDASAHVFASWTCYISLLFMFTSLLLRCAYRHPETNNSTHACTQRQLRFVFPDWKAFVILLTCRIH